MSTKVDKAVGMPSRTLSTPGMVNMGKCVDCDEPWEMEVKNYNWFATEGKAQGLAMPVRCQRCRDIKRDRKLIRARRHIPELRLLAGDLKNLSLEEVSAKLRRIADELQNALS